MCNFYCKFIQNVRWGELDWFKLVFVFISFSEALIAGATPVMSKSFSQSPKVLGVTNTFSAGIFLAIALIHIMPE